MLLRRVARILILLVLCGTPVRAVEFQLLDKLTAKGGVEISTSATALPLIFASSTTNPGNVGIGTAAPGDKLDVRGGGIKIGVSAPTDGVLRLQNTADSGSSYTRMAVAAGSEYALLTYGGSGYGVAVERGLNIIQHANSGGFRVFRPGTWAGTTDFFVNPTGSVGIGVAAPSATLDVGGTDAIKVPSGTTAQRPASPVAGMIRYNATLQTLEFYGGAVARWRGVATSGPGMGGTITDIPGYRVHTFTSNGTFTTSEALVVEVLVVGGGGSGGNHSTTNANGGGGAGGVVYNAAFAVPAGSYAVTVGKGGASVQTYIAGAGNDGGNSVFSTLTALGGGGGGSTGGWTGRSGGSGGGGARSYEAGGAATQPGSASGGFGNAGARSDYSWTGGGGGGAGSAGVAGNACGNCSPSGNGGNGYTSSISGVSVCYAGGGGGGGNSSERAGDGFCGGGRGCGTTSYYNYRFYPVLDTVNPTTLGNAAVDGLPNSGGGGGGGSYWHGDPTITYYNAGSGAGGSGIVIIRYAN